MGVEWIEAFLISLMKVEECHISGEMELLVLCEERKGKGGGEGRVKGVGNHPLHLVLQEMEEVKTRAGQREMKQGRGGRGGSASFCFYRH